MSRELKICILSELAFSLLKGKSIRGGSELQMTLLAKKLVNRLYDVSFVTLGKSSSSFEVVDGIKVFNPFNNRNSGYTYLYPQNMYKLLKTLNKIDADIYIQRAAAPLTGILAFFTKLKNKIFLYSVSSDMEVSTSIMVKSIKDLKNLFFRFGVEYSDVVICQTNHQKYLLKQILNKEGVIIKNLYSLPKIKYNRRDASRLNILWVGRIRREKRPELFLRIAKTIPDFRFWMICSPSPNDPEYYNKIKEVANRIKNLDFLGFVPHNIINRYYSKSSLLVNTSPNEGFPNTFLEAWGNCIPVVSLEFDPDEIICKNKLGLHSKTFVEMIKDLKTLLKDEKLRAEMGMNSRKYVEKEHNEEKIINKYEQLFESLVT